MTREERARAIAIICGKVGCNEQQKERHYRSFVDQEYSPHASLRFKAWWFKQAEFKESRDAEGNGINPIAAQNASEIWKAYLEAKEIGIA